MYWSSNWESTIRSIREDGHRAFIALVELDRDDSDEANGGWVTFDAYDFDRVGPPWDEFWDDGDALLAVRAPFNEVRARFPNAVVEDGGWVLFDAHSVVDNEMLAAEVILFGDNQEGGQKPPSIGISQLEIIPEDATWYLLESSMLARERRSPAWLISAMLNVPLQDVAKRNIAVAVYDVGQGNCNAIVDQNSYPRIFFDYGWAPNFHAKSRPSLPLQLHCLDFCVTAPVVLSHWDMDHWSYAIKSSSFNPTSLHHEARVERRGAAAFLDCPATAS